VAACQIRWVDMDAYRHVNNTVYLRYLEQARLEFMGFLIGFGDAPPKAADAEASDGMVIAELEIAYRRPLVFREQPVFVHSWITHLGNSSVKTRNVVLDETGEYAVSTSRMVCIDRVSTRPRPLRVHERTYLERFLVATS
jgi:acyl-CoA thioester hydrolase